MEEKFWFIAFESTHLAIKFESLLIDTFDIELFPTPREITVSCGLALKFKAEDDIAIKSVLKETDKEGTRLFKMHKIDKTLRIKEITWEEFYAA